MDMFGSWILKVLLPGSWHIPRQTHQNGNPIEKILQLIAFHFWFS
jgi:hypothetical protein